MTSARPAASWWARWVTIPAAASATRQPPAADDSPAPTTWRSRRIVRECDARLPTDSGRTGISSEVRYANDRLHGFGHRVAAIVLCHHHDWRIHGLLSGTSGAGSCPTG